MFLIDSFVQLENVKTPAFAPQSGTNLRSVQPLENCVTLLLVPIPLEAIKAGLFDPLAEDCSQVVAHPLMALFSPVHIPGLIGAVSAGILQNSDQIDELNIQLLRYLYGQTLGLFDVELRII
jgi:hypothetical protein